MLDLSQAASSHTGSLSKVSTTRDGTAADALIYEATMVFTIENEVDADIVDKILRGTRAYYDAYKDQEETGKISRAPKELSGRFEVIHVDDAVTIVDAIGEVFNVEVAKARKVTTFTVKARFRGLDSAIAAHFARYLARRLLVKWEIPAQQQAALPFAQPAATNAVQVITADDGGGGFLFGIQTGVDGTRVMLDDFGASSEVEKDAITSKVIFAPEHGASGPPLVDVIAPYAERVANAGGALSWKYLVLAVAESRGGDLGLDAGLYRVTEAELKRAEQLAIDAVAS